MKKFLHPWGFTLIELLVVMAVIALIGGVIMSIFFSVLRGANKANKLIVVRQNGNYAISQISKIIRDAKGLESPTNCDENGETTPSITVTGQDGRPTTLGVVVVGGKSSIASSSANSANLTDSNAVAITGFTFSCSQAENSNTVLITVSFTVMQSGGDAASENTASLPFSTSIAFRNYQ